MFRLTGPSLTETITHRETAEENSKARREILRQVGLGGLREESRMSPLSATLSDNARKTWLTYLLVEFKWTLKD
jgi:hypothetical protein